MNKSKIVLRHSHIIINNYNMGDAPRLERFFSVYDKLYHTYILKVLEYKEDTKQLIVPRGIDIDYLKNMFDTDVSIDYKNDPYDRVEPILLKTLPRDNVQKEALAFMCGEREYSDNKKHSQLAVNLDTGKGKTYCAITLAAINRLRSIVITSSIDWLEQWRDFIIEYTDTSINEIYMMIGSASIHRLLDRDISKYKFILASHGTLKSYGDTNGWEKITELFKYIKVGHKFYDEAHLNFDNMAKIDAYTNTYKTYYVTATPGRSDRNENILFKYYMKNVPSIDLYNYDEDARTKYIGILYNSNPTALDISKCKNVYGFDRNRYSDYIITRDNFYKILRVLLNMAIKNDKKNIFYISTNRAIKIIYNWIIENYPELVDDVGIFTSIIKENKEEQLEKRIILSTTKSLGTAQDIKDLKMIFVLAEPFASKILAKQTLGRLRDKDTFYVEIVDIGFRRIRDFYNSKRTVFNKYALETSEVLLDNIALNAKVNLILNERDRIYKKLNIITFNKNNEIISFNTNNIMRSPISFI